QPLIKHGRVGQLDPRGLGEGLLLDLCDAVDLALILELDVGENAQDLTELDRAVERLELTTLHHPLERGARLADEAGQPAQGDQMGHAARILRGVRTSSRTTCPAYRVAPARRPAGCPEPPGPRGTAGRD